ncbi:hypothetical protein O6H91_05G088100 [Diphasiastrum complanatum]|uniref:Uncharacterized protein n=1 Tax=Diphasiastrum complanatum TaxID=34168 RepID=A0ACC2DQI2_DIPCM|nr:hypothetical protein O6H91_05G088100 [Diphasiastrum complanatum]
MGAVCSKKAPNDCTDSQPSGIRLHYTSPQEWPSPLHPHPDSNFTETKACRSASSIIPDIVDTEMEKLQSNARKRLAYRLEHEISSEKENVEVKLDQVRLSRVLSHKAKTAKTRTSTAAKKGAAKVSEVGSLLGRAGTAGLEKAVEALDTVGSSLTTLGGGFTTGVAAKAIKIEILAFEVANTVVKGFNLMQALSDDDVRMLKEEILFSEAVQHLVSKDLDELWSIAAADKRNELQIFTREVVRFGNRCRDPRWHQLSRIFDKFGIEMAIPRQKKEEIEDEMDQLMTLAQYTAELYHELHTLDRFRSDLRRKFHDEELMTQRGENIALLKSDLKTREKHVKVLKKRSLWSKFLEEVIENLVDIAYYLHQRLEETFGPAEHYVNVKISAKDPLDTRLGTSGLALHYANIINQIDNLASRPGLVPPNTRDSLYQGLPPNVRVSLRNKLSKTNKDDELTVVQIKAEMEKILEWLAPVAVNTNRAHHGFGWVGEWAIKGAVIDRRLAGNTELSLLQTLHHADQAMTETYILDLLVLLHLLVNRARNSMNGHKSPIRSPAQKKTALPVVPVEKPLLAESCLVVKTDVELSQEDREMLSSTIKTRKRHAGMSKSQELNTGSKQFNRTCNRLSKSNSHSPSSTQKVIFPPCKRHHAPVILSLDLDIDRINEIDLNHSSSQPCL